MSSTVSSPVPTADSPLRTCGKFVPSEPLVEAMTGPPAPSPPYEPSEDDSAERSQRPQMCGEKRPADAPQRSTAAARAEQFLKREDDRQARIEGIARLDHREQIERLVEEIDHLRLHVDMQDKALNGFHKRGIQKEKAAAEEKKELDNRLWSMENKVRRDSVTEADDIKRSILAMASFDTEVDKRVCKLEKESKAHAVISLGQRREMLHMKLEMDEIEKEFQEMRARMERRMKILDEVKEKARASFDVRHDDRAMVPDSEVPCPGQWKLDFDGDDEWNDIVAEVPSPGKRRFEGCPHVQTKGCPQLEHLTEDESPAKRRRSLEERSFVAPYPG